MLVLVLEFLLQSYYYTQDQKKKKKAVNTNKNP